MPTTTPRTPDPAASLARCVGDVEQFLSDGFTRRPHRHHGGAFDDLLSLADVDAQLTGAGLRRPVVRVVRGGEVIDPSTWTRGARTGAVRIDDLVHPGRVLDLFGDGATIVLQSLQRWWPPVARFCRDLEGVLGHAVQANAYLTPPDAEGLTPHHDTHDVFVLQVHGSKQWTVREPLVVDPLQRQRSDHAAAAEQPTLLEAELRPGDCLYLPRGFIHSAATQSGTSLHLTIGVLARTVHDVLGRLVDLAAEQEQFRRTLPSGRGVVPQRQLLKELVAELTGWLDTLPAELDDEQVAGLLATLGRRPPSLDGQLLDLAALGDLDDTTVLVVRTAGTEVREVDDLLQVELGDRRVELPAALRPAVELLLDGAPHAVSELSHLLDGPSRAVLARRLVREGALRTVDGP